MKKILILLSALSLFILSWCVSSKDVVKLKIENEELVKKQCLEMSGYLVPANLEYISIMSPTIPYIGYICYKTKNNYCLKFCNGSFFSKYDSPEKCMDDCLAN